VSDHRELRQQTRTLLTNLGRDRDEVAESLRAAGVLGRPRNNRSCAVARYLTVLLGSDPRVRTVTVGPCSLLIDLATPPNGRPAGRLLVQLPKPVRRFIAAFDAQEYPEVVEEPCPLPFVQPSLLGYASVHSG
jgi:hypothetical protein